MRIPLLNKCKSLNVSTWHVKWAKWKAVISISHAKSSPNTLWSLDEWLFHPLIDSFTQYLLNTLFVGHWSGYWEWGCNSEGKVPQLWSLSSSVIPSQSPSQTFNLSHTSSSTNTTTTLSPLQVTRLYLIQKCKWLLKTLLLICLLTHFFPAHHPLTPP